MACFAVLIESDPEDAQPEPGAIVALFGSQLEAERFRQVAEHRQWLPGRKLAVAGFPPAAPRAYGQAA